MDTLSVYLTGILRVAGLLCRNTWLTLRICPNCPVLSQQREYKSMLEITGFSGFCPFVTHSFNKAKKDLFIFSLFVYMYIPLQIA